jgi:hypothetical protein
MPRHSGNRDAADRRNSPVHGGFSKAPATRSDFDSSCSLFAQADIDSVTNANARRLHTLALGARLPTMHGTQEQLEAGGLMSYGADFVAPTKRSGYPRRW